MLQQYVTHIEDGNHLVIRYGDAWTIYRRASSAIICSYTAMFFYGYIDKVPDKYYLASDRGDTHPRLALTRHVKWRERSFNTVLIGLAKARFWEVELLIYDRDRIICDCIRDSHRMDKAQCEQALHAYINDPLRNMSHLEKYAEALLISRNVHEIFGPDFKADIL